MQDIERRINWYYENVMPAIEYFKNNSYYKFISINGEQEIQKVHEDILKAANL